MLGNRLLGPNKTPLPIAQEIPSLYQELSSTLSELIQAFRKSDPFGKFLGEKNLEGDYLGLETPLVNIEVYAPSAATQSGYEVNLRALAVPQPNSPLSPTGKDLIFTCGENTPLNDVCKKIIGIAHRLYGLGSKPGTPRHSSAFMSPAPALTGVSLDVHMSPQFSPTFSSQLSLIGRVSSRSSSPISERGSSPSSEEQTRQVGQYAHALTVAKTTHSKELAALKERIHILEATNLKKNQGEMPANDARILELVSLLSQSKKDHEKLSLELSQAQNQSSIEIGALKQSVIKADAEKTRLEQQIKQLEDSLTQAQKDAELVKNQYKTLQGHTAEQVKTLQEKLIASEKLQTTLAESREQLQKTLEGARKEAERAQENYTRALTSHESHLAQAKTSLVESEAQIAQLKDSHSLTLSSLRSQLETSQATIEAQQRQLEVAEKERESNAASYQLQLAASQEKLRLLTKEKEKVEADFASKIERVQSDAIRVKEQLDVATNTAETLRKELTAAQVRVAELEKKQTEANAKIKEAEAAVSELQGQLREAREKASKEAKAHHQALERVNQRVEKLQKEKEETEKLVTAQQSAATQEIERLSESLKLVEKQAALQIKQLTTQLETAKITAQQIEKEREEAAAHSESRLKEANAVISDLKQEIAQTNEMLLSLRQKSTAEQNILETLEKRAAETRETIARLEGELQGSRKEARDMLVAQLQAAKEHILSLEKEQGSAERTLLQEESTQEAYYLEEHATALNQELQAAHERLKNLYRPLMENKKRLQAQFETAHAATQSLQSQLTNTERQKASEIESLRKQLEAEKQKATAVAAEHYSTVKGLEIEVEEARKSAIQMAADTEKAKKTQQAQVEELESRFSKVQEELHTLKQTAAQEKVRVEKELSGARNVAAEALSSFEKAKTENQAQIATLSQQLEAAQRENQQLINAQTKASKDHQEQLQKAEKDAAQLSTQHQEAQKSMQSQIARTKTQLENVRSQYTALAETLCLQKQQAASIAAFRFQAEQAKMNLEKVRSGLATYLQETSLLRAAKNEEKQTALLLAQSSLPKAVSIEKASRVENTLHRQFSIDGATYAHFCATKFFASLSFISMPFGTKTLSVVLSKEQATQIGLPEEYLNETFEFTLEPSEANSSKSALQIQYGRPVTASGKREPTHLSDSLIRACITVARNKYPDEGHELEEIWNALNENRKKIAMLQNSLIGASQAQKKTQGPSQALQKIQAKLRKAQDREKVLTQELMKLRAKPIAFKSHKIERDAYVNELLEIVGGSRTYALLKRLRSEVIKLTPSNPKGTPWRIWREQFACLNKNWQSHHLALAKLKHQIHELDIKEKTLHLNPHMAVAKEEIAKNRAQIQHRRAKLMHSVYVGFMDFCKIDQHQNLSWQLLKMQLMLERLPSRCFRDHKQGYGLLPEEVPYVGDLARNVVTLRKELALLFSGDLLGSYYA